ALVYLNWHLTGVLDFERPPTIAIALGHDQVNRLGHALLGYDVGATQVLKPPQHVVVPPGRKGEAGPRGTALAISLDHFAGGPPTEEAALEEILLPTQTGRSHFRAAPEVQLELEQSLQHADRGVERRTR